MSLDGATLLRRLARRLDDGLLSEVAPEVAPEDCRRLLLRLAVGADGGATPAATAGRRPKAQPLMTVAAPEEPTEPPAGNKGLEEAVLYSDGASRGNPGRAGAGFVILDPTGAEVLARGVDLGVCTNNVAEYRALILGLTAALALGVRRLTVRMDSELIVRQVNGLYQVKNANLKPLFQEVKGLLRRFQSWRVEHVPRAANARADGLANQGIDRSASS